MQVVRNLQRVLVSRSSQAATRIVINAVHGHSSLRGAPRDEAIQLFVDTACGLDCFACARNDEMKMHRDVRLDYGCAKASASPRARTTRSRFPSLAKERMERREAPGVCETPYDEPLREVRPRAATRAECESVSRGARVVHRWGCEAHRADAAPPGAPPASPGMMGWRENFHSFRVMSAEKQYRNIILNY